MNAHITKNLHYMHFYFNSRKQHYPIIKVDSGNGLTLFGLHPSHIDVIGRQLYARSYHTDETLLEDSN